MIEVMSQAGQSGRTASIAIAEFWDARTPPEPEPSKGSTSATAESMQTFTVGMEAM